MGIASTLTKKWGTKKMNKKKAFVCDYKCSPFVAMLQNKQLTQIDIIIVA